MIPLMPARRGIMLKKYVIKIIAGLSACLHFLMLYRNSKNYFAEPDARALVWKHVSTTLQ